MGSARADQAAWAGVTWGCVLTGLRTYVNWYDQRRHDRVSIGGTALLSFSALRGYIISIGAIYCNYSALRRYFISIRAMLRLF